MDIYPYVDIYPCPICCLRHHPASLPQFPHHYLWGSQAPGRFVSLTPYLPGCKIPKIQERDSSTQHALLCITRFPPAGRAGGEGGAQLQAGVHLFTLLLGFYTPCWPAAPSSLSAPGTGSCPDHREGRDSSVPSHQQKEPPLHHCEHRGPSSAFRPPTHKTHVKKRAVLPDETHLLFSVQQRPQAFQEQVRATRQPGLPQGGLRRSPRCSVGKTARVSPHPAFSMRRPPRRELSPRLSARTRSLPLPSPLPAEGTRTGLALGQQRQWERAVRDCNLPGWAWSENSQILGAP